MINKEILARRMLEAIDEDVCEKFCTGCEAIEFTPATFTDPAEEHCPAEFCPGNPGCVKEEQYLEMLAAIEEAI